VRKNQFPGQVVKVKEAISRGANKEEENAKTPIGRSLKHLIEVVTDLEKRGIGFKSLTENIDTTTSGGKLIFHIFGALAELERNLIRERTQAWLEAARARGHLGGRPKA
jgi:DNA invertase Pin-like site-specific DNA recombinase